MECVLGKQLIDQAGQLLDAADVLGEKNVIIFLFSASWCTSCDEVMPLLKELYEESTARQSGFEVILVSSDLDQEKFEEYYHSKNGPWYAVPFEDPTAEELRWRFGITSLPSLAVIRADGSKVTNTAIRDLQTLGINVLVTWSEPGL